MKINIITWNTQLYEYGNLLFDNKLKRKSVKPIDYIHVNNVLKYISEYINKENAIAVLQEIPLKNNVTHSEHIVFTLLCGAFPQSDYTILYNVNELVRNQIKMTVVIAKNGLIEKDYNGMNSTNEDYCNCYVSFKLSDLNIRILGIHAHNAIELYSKLEQYKAYDPYIILGDFNAGNYKKNNADEQFKSNISKYCEILKKGYTDLCNGQITRQYKCKNGFVYKTPIDHVLIRNDIGLFNEYKFGNVIVHSEVAFSDHYPITFEIETK